MEGLVLVVVSGLLVGGLAWVFSRRRRRSLFPRRRVVCLPQRYDAEPVEGSHSVRSFRVHDEVAPRSTRLQDQPERWRREMAGLGEAARHAGVIYAVFVHGTFVGTDPFSLLSSIQRLYPRMDNGVVSRVGVLWRTATSQLNRDRGNFQPGYVKLFAESTSVPASLFVWSSENTHGARLNAAAQLAYHISARLDELKGGERGRVLLVGHSHAGQIFALLLQMLTECSHAPTLLRLAGELGEDIDWLKMHLHQLQRREVDVVTLGTPARYGWPAPSHERILHIVNHRGPEPMGGRLDGVLTTRDGDYIQQWGVAGSDLPSTSASLKRINTELDEVLGLGHDPRKWLQNLEHRKRVHEGGHTMLVDYGDQSTSGPNCIATNFGHSIYTRRRTMRFWMRVAAQRLYSLA